MAELIARRCGGLDACSRAAIAARVQQVLRKPLLRCATISSIALAWRIGGFSISAAVRATLLHSSHLRSADGGSNRASISPCFAHSDFAALVLSVLLAAPLVAETTPAPPDWKDGQGHRFIWQTNQTRRPTIRRRRQYVCRRHAAGRAERLVEPAPLIAAPPKVDSAVVPAVHEAPSAASDSDIATACAAQQPCNDNAVGAKQPRRARRRGDLPISACRCNRSTRSSRALAIVIGAFLLFAWALRRGESRIERPSRIVAGRRRERARPRAAGRAAVCRAAARRQQARARGADADRADNAHRSDRSGRSRSARWACASNSIRTARPRRSSKCFNNCRASRPAAGFLGSEPLPTSLSSAAAAAYRAIEETGAWVSIVHATIGATGSAVQASGRALPCLRCGLAALLLTVACCAGDCASRRAGRVAVAARTSAGRRSGPARKGWRRRCRSCCC